VVSPDCQPELSADDRSFCASAARDDHPLYQGWFQMLYIDLPLFMASTFSISSFYLVSQKELFPRTWPRAFLYLPFLMALGID
jgi:hypothetical protein